MSGRQWADLDGGSTLFSLWNCMEELLEIVHKGRKYHLIIRTAGQIKDWNAYEVTDDLGINSDDVPVKWTAVPSHDHHPAPPPGWHRRV
jgi:hypothetical protein